MAKPVWSVDQIVSQLTNWGTFWSDGQPIAYSFYNAPPAHLGFPPGYSSFTPDQRASLARTLELIADVANVSFVEVADNGLQPGEGNERLSLYNIDSANAPYWGALTFLPTESEVIPYGRILGGEIVVNQDRASWQGNWETGSSNSRKLMHEVLHALGLDHPGPYNGDGPTYATDALFAQDTVQYTVMSYWAAAETGADHVLGNQIFFASTPLLFDVAALQAIYGANLATRTGDTVYGFNSTAGREAYDLSLAPAAVFTIWDAGGVDTLDLSGYVLGSRIDLGEGKFSDAGGLTGNISIAFGAIVENAIGGKGNDVITGNDAANRLVGGGGADSLSGGTGADTLEGGTGADTLFGGAGSDTFRGLAAHLDGDIIMDLAVGDRIVISDATFAGFDFSLSGSTLIFTGGSLTLGQVPAGNFYASAAPEGGVQLVLEEDSLPPGMSRARLLLTESGQDFVMGGDVEVTGTAGTGEVIEILRGDVRLDASFNKGGDTIVLPGAANGYTAQLAGSFVILAGNDIHVAIPVGVSGLAVQFGDSTRTLWLDTDSGQVLLGTQAVTSSEAVVDAAGPALLDLPETGPDSFGLLILTQAGQDVDIGGMVSVIGTVAADEIINVLGGTIRLDASFNAGGDVVVLPGAIGDYTASLAGSFVTLTDGETSVAIPVGVAGLTIDFSDLDLVLRIDTSTGQVVLGDQTVATSAAGAQTWAKTDVHETAGWAGLAEQLAIDSLSWA